MGYERFEAPYRAPVPRWRERLGQYWKLVRGDRPIGVLLLLWPTWWALWLAAGGVPPLWTLFVFTAGVWLTRSAGCVINDYADRWLDPHVERTKARPLATGRFEPRCGQRDMPGQTVAVAQLVESRIVIPVVVGSSPISHPNFPLSLFASIPLRATRRT